MAQESRFKRITQFTTDYSPSTITKCVPAAPDMEDETGLTKRSM